MHRTRYFACCVVALLAGLVIGGWGPRSELRHMEEELATVRKLLKEKPGRTESLEGVTRLLGIGPGERTRADASSSIVPSSSGDPDVPVSQPGEPLPESKAGTTGLEEDVATDTDDGQDSRRDRAANGNMKEQIEKAAELWQMRSDIARSTFIANTSLNDEQTIRFDVLVEAMNLRLADTMEQFAESIADVEVLQPEAGIRLANEVLDALVLTYDEMDRGLPDDWRNGAGGAFSIVNFINPAVATPLIGVEDKLSEMERGQSAQ